MLKYIELKSDCSHNGPAWVAKIKCSKTGGTIYFNGMALKKMKGGGVSGNYYDLESGDEYWISGIKKQGLNQHWAGSGKIFIEERAVEEFLSITESTELVSSSFMVCADLQDTDGSQFVDIENRTW